ERNVIAQTKYYRDSISNLVKLRKDDDFSQVGGRWRPATIGFEGLRPPSTTRLALTWREAPDAPAALLTPAGLRAPSTLVWQYLGAKVAAQLGRQVLERLAQHTNVALRGHDQPQAQRVHGRPGLGLGAQVAVQIGDVGAVIGDRPRHPRHDARLVDPRDDAL